MNKLLEIVLTPPGLYVIGWGITGLTFFWKLSADSRYARYRETVAYIEKREVAMRDRWSKVSNLELEIEEKAEDVYAFFAQLELISLLVSKKAFDEELVYSFWWRYFDEPLRDAEINMWLMLEQASDRHVFSHYIALCKKWSKQIDSERDGKQIGKLLSKT